jgi:2-oxoisovalerate dehydrogenase E1 component
MAGAAWELEWLRRMQLIRTVDRQERSLIRQGKGWIHIPSEGHEALATIAAALGEDDLIFGYYRDRPLFMSRGVSVEQMAFDYFACAGSSTRGRAMPLHGTARELGIFPPVTPTAGQCLPASGAAWGIKMKGGDGVVICTIGDAATRQGEFYEAVCFAVQESLPIVFVVEDNGFGISTPTKTQMPFRLGIFSSDLWEKAPGNDPRLVKDAAHKCIDAARSGKGPSVLWLEVDRLSSHTNSDDQRIYRSEEELRAQSARDPILLLEDRLIDHGILSREIWNLEKNEIKRFVDRCYQVAEGASQPNPAEVCCDLRGPDLLHGAIPVGPGSSEDTMVNAVNRTLDAALRTHGDVVVFGEDIEDPKGGVFGLTKGLSTRFPGRVHNAPLAEATIVGVAAGLSAVGWRPIVELQFIDFLTPAMNQLINQLTTLRWRSAGEWVAPVVLYAPYGAYLPGGGIWHSGSNDGFWAHIPGLRVAIPSDPQDASDLFWNAIHSDDPSLILLPKHIFRKKLPARTPQAIPFGKARICRHGSDVTIITWGNCVELAIQAASDLEKMAINTEVLDLRTLVPCDANAILASVRKTGRLVVVTEDTRLCSFGQAVVADILGTPEGFDCFYSAPAVVARADVQIPFSPALEYEVLPSVGDIVAAVQSVMQ